MFKPKHCPQDTAVPINAHVGQFYFIKVKYKAFEMATFLPTELQLDKLNPTRYWVIFNTGTELKFHRSLFIEI